MSGVGEGFLSRWSRRKRAEVREEPGADESAAPFRDAPAPPGPEPSAAPAPGSEPGPAAESEPTLSDEELAALPPIETIDETTDIGGYLRKGVPAALKNAALRRVWSATPAVRDYLDPAREYAYDWNVPGGVPGDGPLPPGFDARALADKLFAKRETKVADDQGALPPGENTNDALSQTADAGASTAGPEAIGDARDAEPGAERRGASIPESSAEHGIAPGSDAPPPEPTARGEGENTLGFSDFRPRPRRHGGATPG